MPFRRTPPELDLSTCSLVKMDLSENSLQSGIPGRFGEFKTFTFLDLRNNQLHGNLPVSLIGMAKLQDVQSRVSDAVFGKENPVEETDPDYENLKHYILKLEDHLSEAPKQAFRLVK